MLINLTINKVEESQPDHVLCGQAVSVLPVSLIKLKIAIRDVNILELNGIGLGELYRGVIEGYEIVITRNAGTPLIQIHIKDMPIYKSLPITISCDSTGFNLFVNTFVVYGYDVQIRLVLVPSLSENAYSNIEGWTNPLTNYKHFYNASSSKGVYNWLEDGAIVSNSINHITKYVHAATLRVDYYRQRIENNTIINEVISTCHSSIDNYTYNIIPTYNAELENNAQNFTANRQLIFSVNTANLSTFIIDNVATKVALPLLMKVVVKDFFHNVVESSTIIENTSNTFIERWFNLNALNNVTRYKVEYGIKVLDIFASNKELTLNEFSTQYLVNTNDNTFTLKNIKSVIAHFVVKEFIDNKWVITIDKYLAPNETLVFTSVDGFHLLIVDDYHYGFTAYANVIKKITKSFEDISCGYKSAHGTNKSDCDCGCNLKKPYISFCSLYLFVSILEVALKNFYGHGVNIGIFTAEFETKFKSWNKAIFNVLKKH